VILWISQSIGKQWYWQMDNWFDSSVDSQLELYRFRLSIDRIMNLVLVFNKYYWTLLIHFHGSLHPLMWLFWIVVVWLVPLILLFSIYFLDYWSQIFWQSGIQTNLLCFIHSLHQPLYHVIMKYLFYQWTRYFYKDQTLLDILSVPKDSFYINFPISHLKIQKKVSEYKSNCKH